VFLECFFSVEFFDQIPQSNFALFIVGLVGSPVVGLQTNQRKQIILGSRYPYKGGGVSISVLLGLGIGTMGGVSVSELYG